MRTRFPPCQAFYFCDRFVTPSLTRLTHAEPPVNERATTMSVGHRVGHPTTIKPFATRSTVSHTAVHFRVNTVGFKHQPILP